MVQLFFFIYKNKHRLYAVYFALIFYLKSLSDLSCNRKTKIKFTVHRNTVSDNNENC